MPYFKYMGSKASLKFLEDQTVRFSPPSEYNDPFELTPEIKLKEKLPQSNKKISISLVGGKPNIEAYEIPESELLSYQYHLGTDLIFNINKVIGVSCFSYSTTFIPVNVLMWAHYAESHKGIAIQLKESSEFINDLSPVVYRRNKPVIDGRFLSDNEEICMKDLYVKSEIWKYESEYRLSKRLDDCHEVGSGSGIFVSKIPAEHIERVVLGVNASEELRQKALNFFYQHGVQVIMTKCAKSGFGFEPVRLHGVEYSDAVIFTQCYKYESL